MAKGGGSAGILVLILMILLTNIQVEGRSYTVAWGFVSYKKLSATKFKRGDILVFNYPRYAHDVVQVSSLKDYTNCVVSKGARKNKSGHDKITLRRGVNYFICSVPGHCQNGMKVKVVAY